MHFIHRFQIQNDALRNDIHTKQVTIWKAFQLLQYVEGKLIQRVQKTSFQYFDHQLQEYEFANQMNESDLLTVDSEKNQDIK